MEGKGLIAARITTKARGIEFDLYFAKRDFFSANPTKTISETALMAPPPTEG